MVFVRRARLAVCAGVCLLFSYSLASADITVAQAWARATPGPVAAVYMVIESSDEDRLIGVSCDVAKRCLLHGTKREDGVDRMHHVDSVAVRQGEPLVLAPGGMHLMLMGLQDALLEGEHFSIYLDFEQQGEVPVSVDIVSVLGPGE